MLPDCEGGSIVPCLQEICPWAKEDRLTSHCVHSGESVDAKSGSPVPSIGIGTSCVFPKQLCGNQWNGDRFSAPASCRGRYSTQGVQHWCDPASNLAAAGTVRSSCASTRRIRVANDGCRFCGRNAKGKARSRSKTGARHQPEGWLGQGRRGGQGCQRRTSHN